MTRGLTFLILLALGTAVATAHPCDTPEAYPHTILSLQWLPSELNLECFNPPCVTGRFTIHGLWPSTPRKRAERPNAHLKVHHDTPAIETMIRTFPELHQDLAVWWPSRDNKHTHFWAHEWGKHGIEDELFREECYADGTSLHQRMHDYFATTVDLAKRHHVGAWLAKGGVIPDSTRRYTLRELQTAIPNAQFTCRGHHLYEVRLTFTVKYRNDYTLIPTTAGSGCPRTDIIYG